MTERKEDRLEGKFECFTLVSTGMLYFSQH